MTGPIVLTGPESAGKTTLSKALAASIQLPNLDEYAREFLENCAGKYTFDDVIKMAREQLRQENEFCLKHNNQCILDTDLTVYHVWIKEVYGAEIPWIEEAIATGINKQYLLCDIDLPWKFDPLREHPLEADRKRLFQEYIEVLERHKLSYKIISGLEENRLKNAIACIAN